MTDTVVVAPIKYTGQALLQQDIDNFKAALEDVKVVEGFLPVAAPASVIPDRKNEYYKSEDDLVDAIGEAMHDEYKQIVDNGLLVQLDDARAAVTYDRMVPPGSFKDYRKWVAQQHGRAQPRDRGHPDREDPLSRLLGKLARAAHHRRADARHHRPDPAACAPAPIVLEMANPRHEHEWQVWKDVKLPKGAVLIPGVISHATNVVEHPELVGGAHRAARQAGRPRERHRRHRLRLRAAAVLPARPSDDPVGQAARRWPRARGSPARNCGAGGRRRRRSLRRRRQCEKARCQEARAA